MTLHLLTLRLCILELMALYKCCSSSSYYIQYRSGGLKTEVKKLESAGTAQLVCGLG